MHFHGCAASSPTRYSQATSSQKRIDISQTHGIHFGPASNMPLTIDEFFAGRPESRALFESVRAAVESVGPSTLRVTKSQIAFRRRRAFAWGWIPGRYLRGRRPPLVLSVALRRRDESARWKEVVEPAPGRFMRHLELTEAGQVDDEVRARLREAWAAD